jgi:fatty-acyl-CoA synthase
VGAPDPIWGEIVVAVVVCRPGAQLSAEDIIATCRAELASYKKPRHVVFVDHIPKGVTGKPLKGELRRRLSG